MKVIGIIQARMGSTRLPGKVLMEAAGKPLILHMLDRVRCSALLDEIWLATSDQPQDDQLAETVAAGGYPVFRGSENDVLDRFYQLAKKCDAEIVVRLTGDCPLHDASVIDRTIQAFMDAYPKYHYGSNILPPTYPDGLDIEVFTFKALEDVAIKSANPLEREHVTLGIHRQFHDAENKPEVLNITGPADFSHLRWTLDNPEDYTFIKEVFERLYVQKPDFTWMDVIALITRNPWMLGINMDLERNEVLVQAIREGQLDQKETS